MRIHLNKTSRFFFTSMIVGALFYSAACFCNKQTGNFSVARIHSDLAYNPAWETTPLSVQKKAQMKQILDQKFHYLGCGGQCFAFASEDGQYVIKFFKHKIRKPYSLFLRASLPAPLEKKRLKKLNKALYKLDRDFTSYKIAYEDLCDETGLLFIHLNKGNDLDQTITIIDKIGIAHQIDLDNIEFVVQKRATLVYSYIEDLMTKGDVEKAKLALHSILDVIISRCKKGIFDEDARIHRNFGFIGSQPIFIDVGRFRRDPERKEPLVYKNDLENIIGRFRHWLEESYPELVSTLDEELYALQKEI